MKTYKIKPGKRKFYRLNGYIALVPSIWLSVFYIAYQISFILLFPIAILFLIACLSLFELEFNLNLFALIKDKLKKKKNVFENLKLKRKFEWVIYLSFIHTLVLIFLVVILDLLLNLDYEIFG